MAKLQIAQSVGLGGVNTPKDRRCFLNQIELTQQSRI